MSRIATLAAGAVLLMLGVSCATTTARPGPSVAIPLLDALASMGAVDEFPGAADTPEIVILKDRHAVGPGIFYVDEELRGFQRDQHAVMTHLVARGFRLLGCEHALGPLPENAAAADHRAVIDEARASGDDLNRWSVYQPIRYAVEFAGRLEVLGVEDPALYQADLDTLSQLERTIQARQAGSQGGPSARQFAAEETRLLLKIRANVDARGAAAAQNLVELMRRRGSDKAILMLGASHVPSAAAALTAAGVRHFVFEAPGFKRRS